MADSGDYAAMSPGEQWTARWRVLACLTCLATVTEHEDFDDAWPRLVALHASHTASQSPASEFVPLYRKAPK